MSACSTVIININSVGYQTRIEIDTIQEAKQLYAKYLLILIIPGNRHHTISIFDTRYIEAFLQYLHKKQRDARGRTVKHVRYFDISKLPYFDTSKLFHILINRNFHNSIHRNFHISIYRNFRYDTPTLLL